MPCLELGSFLASEMLQSIGTEVIYKGLEQGKVHEGKERHPVGGEGILLRGRFKISVKPVFARRASVCLIVSFRNVYRV